MGASGSLYFNNDTRDLGNDDCGTYCDSICTPREGCTDPAFMEFDQFAVLDDGSCRIPVAVLHVDDGVCPPRQRFYDFTGGGEGTSTTTAVRSCCTVSRRVVYRLCTTIQARTRAGTHPRVRTGTFACSTRLSAA